MAAALDNFSIMDAPAKMCILGDMRELGDSSMEEHIKVLNQILSASFPEVWLVGEEFKKALSTLPAVPNGISTFADANEAMARISETEIAGHTILIKGSNSTRLISLVDSL
jgi:UDP-N-acetylmuramoyl-tripeptide--D-alanyl-D-alanine ligase